MADAKTYPIVTLVAVERGFAMGRMLEPGQSFQFDTTPPEPVAGKVFKLAKDGSRRLPKWAAMAEDAAKRLEAKKVRLAGDLKPNAAQSAVKAKAQAFSE